MSSVPSASRGRFAAALGLAIALLASNARAQETTPSGPTLDQLATAIAGDPAQAWTAVSELRALPLATAKDRAAAKKLAAAWAEELVSAATPGERIVRAHAIGALGESGEPSAAALARGCSTQKEALVRLACALALADLGDAGVKAAAKELASDDLVGGALICAALARPGARSPATVKALEKAVKDASSFREFLLAEPAIVALEILGEDAGKPLAARESLRNDVDHPTVGGLNWRGVVEAAPHALVLPMGELGILPDVDVADFAIPERLRKHRDATHLADLYADYLGHLTRVTGELLPPLETGSIASLEDHAVRAKRWTLTIELLMQIEERFLPKPPGR